MCTELIQCVHTHCDAYAELFHIDCETAISPWQEAHRTACGVFICLQRKLLRAAHEKKHLSAERSRKHKSSNAYQHGKSNYTGWREPEKKCRETGEKIGQIKGIKKAMSVEIMEASSKRAA